METFRDLSVADKKTQFYSLAFCLQGLSSVKKQTGELLQSGGVGVYVKTIFSIPSGGCQAGCEQDGYDAARSGWLPEPSGWPLLSATRP